MGSTITCGKAAAAFKHANGTIFYQLFERTYESNVHPKTPHWGAIYFGPIAGAIDTIFSNAAVCEGGMLRGPSKSMRPEAYITAWLRELDEPRLLPDNTIRLKAGDSFMAAFTPDSLPAALSLLRAHDRHEHADALEQAKVATFSLHADAVPLHALVAAELLSRWKLSDRSAPPAETSLDLSHALQIAPVPTIPDYLKLDGDHRLRRNPDGTWRTDGAIYDIIARHIRAIATLDQGGCYKRSIPRVREAAEQAPPIPDGTRAEIDPRHAPDYLAGTITGLQELATDRYDDGRFVIPVPYSTSRLGWDLSRLPAEAITWLIPEAPAATAPAEVAPATAAPAPAPVSLFDLFPIPAADPA